MIDIPDGDKLKAKIIREITEAGGSINKRDFEKKHKNHQNYINDLIAKGQLILLDEKQQSGQSKTFLKVPIEKAS